MIGRDPLRTDSYEGVSVECTLKCELVVAQDCLDGASNRVGTGVARVPAVSLYVGGVKEHRLDIAFPPSTRIHTSGECIRDVR
jgi:hypothetical protein